MIIEQDNLPELSDVDEIEQCPELWCVCPYRGRAKDRTVMLYQALGCTRFRQSLMGTIPDLMSSVYVVTGSRHWQGMDNGIALVLKQHGQNPHHHREIAHLHVY